MIIAKDELSALNSLVKVTNASAVVIEDSGYEKQIQLQLSIGTMGAASDWQDSILDCVDELTDFLDI